MSDLADTGESKPEKRIVSDHVLSGWNELFARRYEAALAHFRDEPDGSWSYAIALGNAAHCLSLLGRLVEAEREGRKAIGYIDSHGCGMPPAHVQFVRNLGDTVARTGRYHEAQIWHGLAVELADEYAAEVVKKLELVKASYPDIFDDLDIQKAQSLNSAAFTLLHLQNPADAVKSFQQALAIYRKYPARTKVGRVEAQTGYAQAKARVGDTTTAALALDDILPFAEAEGDAAQIQRVKIARAQLGGLLPEEAIATLREAFTEARDGGDLPTAFCRLCILIETALILERPDAAHAALAEAKAIEPILSAEDPHPAMLRFQQAKLLLASGWKDRAVAALIDGAHLWVSRLPRIIDRRDVLFTTQELHDHFCALARLLLDAGRLDESLVAFETGRALGYGFELDPSLLALLERVNPFPKGGAGPVDLRLLRTLVSRAPNDAVFLTLARLKPDLVCFLADRCGCHAVSEPIPQDVPALDTFDEQLHKISQRLNICVGADAIPLTVHAFASRIRHAVGDRIVRGLFPHGALHAVPWRAMLRYSGLPWTAMPCATEFGMLLHAPCGATVPEAGCAVGHGWDKDKVIDFRVEASTFANRFGDAGTMMPTATEIDVRDALSKPFTLLLSVHGEALAGRLHLKLQPPVSQTAPMREYVDVPADRLFLPPIAAPLVILSACYSGVYEVAHGDYPTGAAPLLLRSGVRFVLAARFEVGASFTSKFMDRLAAEFVNQRPVTEAFAAVCAAAEQEGADLWSDLACLELVAADPRSALTP